MSGDLLIIVWRINYDAYMYILGYDLCVLLFFTCIWTLQQSGRINVFTGSFGGKKLWITLESRIKKPPFAKWLLSCSSPGRTLMSLNLSIAIAKVRSFGYSWYKFVYHLYHIHVYPPGGGGWNRRSPVVVNDSKVLAMNHSRWNLYQTEEETPWKVLLFVFLFRQ